jgi:hypothetical protein
MITGNKGEWSEVYTLFKLLGDYLLHPGDKDTLPIKDVTYLISKIDRDESNGLFEYFIKNEKVIINHNDESYIIPTSQFKKFSKILLDKIKTVLKELFQSLKSNLS